MTDAVNAFLASAGGFRHEIIGVWSDGDTLVTELEAHYTRLDGQQLTVPVRQVFQLRDGLVSGYRSYIDATPVYA